jgi:hypothetical protein
MLRHQVVVAVALVQPVEVARLHPLPTGTETLALIDIYINNRASIANT